MNDERRGNGSEVARLRVGEDRAAKILERAAALDARRSSEIEIGQLREAAAAAGISREAFEEAMQEQAEESQRGEHGKGNGLGAPLAPAISGAYFAHYNAVLRDVLGDEGEVTVIEDRIEWKDDEGMTVSVSPSAGSTTTAVSAEGRLRTRLLGVILPALLPLLLFLVIAVEEDEAAIALLGGLIVLLVCRC